MCSNSCLRLGGFAFFGRFGFGIGVFQRYQDSEVLGASGGSLALDDVGHAGDEKRLLPKVYGSRSISKRFVGPDSIDSDAEIEL